MKMTLIACEYCGKKFNGLIRLYDHKRGHSAWRRKVKLGLKWLERLDEKGIKV